MPSKILSLHRWLDEHPIWHAQTCSIADPRPAFHSKSLLGKLNSIVHHQNGFDTLVFYYDHVWRSWRDSFSDLLHIGTHS